MCLKWLAAALLILSLLGSAIPLPVSAQSTPTQLIILADPADPFCPLAEEIAGAENAVLVHTWEAAIQANPLAILWVAAPQTFSDPVMIAAGLALKSMPDQPLLGIITGEDIADARALWQRGKTIRGEQLYAANGEFPTAGIQEARLVNLSAEQSLTTPLTKASLAAALAQADYLTFTGHGSPRYMRLDPETTFRAEDVPVLPPAVVSTASCQTLRVWEEGSIALAFTQQGAAVYAGFVYSPLEGYMIGQFQDLPFRYTWPEFPVGMVANLQSHGTLQGFANIPHFFLLGDPRAALQSGPPYRLLEDKVTPAGTRVLRYSSLPAGLVPVRIPQGNAYRYLEIPGVGSAADGDLFFNARIQTLTQGTDRYVLFAHPGGEIEIRLRSNPPLFWGISRPVLDALDHILVFAPQNGGDDLVLIAGVVFFFIGGFKTWRMGKNSGRSLRKRLLIALAAGGLVAGLLVVYQLLRLPVTAINSKPMAFYPVWGIGTCLAVTGGALIFTSTGRLAGRGVGLGMAGFPALAPGLFSLAVISLYNLMISQHTAGVAVYNQHMALLGFLAALPLLLVCLAAFLAINRCLKRVDIHYNNPIRTSQTVDEA